MRRILWVVLGISGVLLGGLLYAHRPKALPDSAATAANETATDPSEQDQQTPEAHHSAQVSSRVRSTAAANTSAPMAESNSANSLALDKSMLTQTVDILVSPQASYEQKKAAWKQLRESGRLD